MASQYPPPPTTPATGPAATTAPTANASSNKKEKWEKMKKQSNIWFQKIGAPVNKLSNKLGAEAFWPTSLDKEADKVRGTSMATISTFAFTGISFTGI